MLSATNTCCLLPTRVVQQVLPVTNTFCLLPTPVVCYRLSLALALHPSTEGLVLRNEFVLVVKVRKLTPSLSASCNPPPQKRDKIDIVNNINRDVGGGGEIELGLIYLFILDQTGYIYH